MKKLILTVGIPRCGKSTWAKQQGFPVVNPDSIRLALHGQAFIPEAEPMVCTMARYMVESLFLAGHDVVILDATNVTAKRRAQWKSEKWDVFVMKIPFDLNTCITRAGDNQDLVATIYRMAQQFQPVNYEVEGLQKWDTPTPRNHGTWTVSSFNGVYLNLTAAVVSADNVYLAKALLEKELAEKGLKQDIPLDKFLPMPTQTRKVRILVDGDY